MRRTFILCVVIFLFLMGILFYIEYGFSPKTTAAEQNYQAITVGVRNSVENEIRQILEKSYEIARTNDREALLNYSRDIVAPEYLYSSELGTMGKQEAFHHFKSANINFISANFDDLKVQFFGDMAIAKYRDLSKVRADGNILRTPTRFTTVWHKRDGKWLIVAEHSSVTTVLPDILPQRILPVNLARN